MWSSSSPCAAKDPTPNFGDDDSKSATDMDSSEITDYTRNINEVMNSLVAVRVKYEQKASELEKCKADLEYYKLQAQAFKEHAKNLEKIIEKKNMEN